MFELGARVKAWRENRLIGVGKIFDLCQDEERLRLYFQSNHPFYEAFCTSIQKNQFVYIVDFDNGMGRAGFLESELNHQNS